MIELPADEKIIASYDHRLIKRIAGLARPFWRHLAVAGFFLVIATVGEMLVPVLIQQTVDRVILESWVTATSPLPAQLQGLSETETINGQVFIREQELDRLPRAARQELRESGAVGTEGYSVFRDETVQLQTGLEEKLRDLPHLRGDSLWAVPDSAISQLDQEARQALRVESLSTLRRYVMYFLAVLILVLAGSFGQVYLTAYTGQLVMHALRIRLFRHTVEQNLGYLGTQPVGKLVTRVTNDVETINELFTSVLSELARNVSLMIAVVITMFTLNARLAGFVLVTMLPVIVLTNVIRRQARRVYRQVREAVSRVNAYLSEYISGISLVQLFVQQERSRREFEERNGSLLAAQIREMYVFAVFRPLVDFLASISTAAVILLGAWLLELDLVSLGVLIAFTNLIRRFYMPVMSISEQFTVLQSAMAGSERVFDLLDQEDKISDSGTTPLLTGTVRGRIQFDRVHFAYKEDEPVLQGLSFDAEPGQFIAIVGYTGAGKTTIINLLTRLWDPQGGAIRLDGSDIRQYPLADLRRAVQQIQQDVFLFDDTIRNNITLGTAVTDEIVWNACQAVQIADFIRGLPDGLDTQLEERGGNLSSGQRQLISFARVLVHDPPVIVLDEATSSIDSETERLLQRALETVTGGRTSLVVAHRLSTIRHAHRILVLSGGVLVETGTHDELLKQHGLYATLYHLQFENQ